MKIYFLDQLLFLVIGIGIMACIPLYCDLVFTCIFGVMMILSWGYLCRRILLFPLDLLHGKKTKQVYFGSQSALVDYEFFTGKYSVEWKFYFGGNGKLYLLVPASVAREEIVLIKRPQKDEYINITYYRFSKILLDWQSVTSDADQA